MFDRTPPRWPSPLLVWGICHIADACFAEGRRIVEGSSVLDEPNGWAATVVATDRCGSERVRWGRLGGGVADEAAEADSKATLSTALLAPSFVSRSDILLVDVARADAARERAVGIARSPS